MEQTILHYKWFDVFTEGGSKSIYTPDMIEVLEEADNRIVCHLKDMLASGITKISVKTKDTDVIVILLGFISQFLDTSPNLKLYVDFNTGVYHKYICINDCQELLGKDICKEFPFSTVFRVQTPYHCSTR